MPRGGRVQRGKRAEVTVRDGYTSHVEKLSLAPDAAKTEEWSVSRTRGWYDLVITVEHDSGFTYRYAGHLENGRDSISDPAIGGLR
jgi:phospholipase C